MAAKLREGGHLVNKAYTNFVTVVTIDNVTEVATSQQAGVPRFAYIVPARFERGHRR
jgi:hypothetical protein